MAGPSDPMLLAKRCRKLLKGMEGAPGTLVVTADKIKWHPEHTSPTVKAVTLDISSVVKQQQAPGKPLLRIVVISGEPLALSFQSESDKNEVLDLLKQQITAHSAGVGGPSTLPSDVPDAAEKRRRFAADKDLEVLYNQLVVNGGLLSEADFWKARDSSSSSISSMFGKMAKIATTSTSTPSTIRQRSGLSSVMHEVERLHDGSTERVSIQLTPRDIQQIFLERQEVHRAYLAHVPHSMNEKEFWKRYFKMEYKKAAKRKRLAAAGRLDVTEEELEDPDDIFAPFKRQLLEEEAASAKRKIGYIDPTVNLVAEFGEKWTSPLFGGGLGSAHTGSEDGPGATGIGIASTNASAKSAATALRVEESIAHDINRHAAQVLDGTLLDLGADRDDTSQPKDTASIAAEVATAIQLLHSRKAGQPQGDSSLLNLRTTAAALEDLSLETDDERRLRSGMTIVQLPPPKPPAELFGDGERLYSDKTGNIGMVGQGGPGKDVIVKVLNSVDAFALSDPFISLGKASSRDNGSAAAFEVLLEVGRDEDENLLAEFGTLASLALTQHPQGALGSVMIVSCTRGYN